MALPDIRKIPPLTINEFRKREDNETIQIPEIPANRNCTDVGFLIFFILAITTTIALVISCIISGTDYNRFLHGSDKCGDTCGKKNQPIEKVECSGKDLTQKPFMKYVFIATNDSRNTKNYILPDMCVAECNVSDRLLFRRCIPFTNMSLNRDSKNILMFTEISHDFEESVYAVIIPNTICGIVLSLGLCFAFYLSPKVSVYSILGLTLIALLCFASYVWYEFVAVKNSKENLIMGITSTIVIFFLSAFTCYFHERYVLLVEIFTEATYALFKQPCLFLVPVVTLLILAVVITSMIFLAALVSTCSNLEEITNSPSVYKYVKTQLSEVTITFLALLIVWILAFANACQCMIVAAPVSAYYFQKDKSIINFSVFKSYYVLIRFHLGTVVFGSLFITIFAVARVSVEFLEDHISSKYTIQCLEYCIVYVEEIVDYLTKRAYIQSAIHGKPLFKSGMRAARLLWANLLDTVSLDVVGDFVMLCATILIILISLGVAICCTRVLHIDLTYYWLILLIGTSITGIAVYFFTQVINVAVETIFICFCEDKLLNDGKNRPYFMSDRLKNLVDKAKIAARRRAE